MFRKTLQKTLFRKTLFCALLLTLAVGTFVVVAHELEPSAEPAVEPVEAGMEVELTDLLAAVEDPLMSVEPERTAAADAGLPTDLAWSRSICYPNTCIPCSTSDTCLLGDRCVYGVICP